MDPQKQKFQTSFIPKKPDSINADNFSSGGKSNLFSIIATLIFVATLVFAGGVYGYKLTIQKQISSQLESLQEARNRLDEGFITNANRLNDRIAAVKQILNNHKSPSEIFSLLEEYTLNSVRFTSLNYSTDVQNVITVDANGVGTGFESVVLQSDQFGSTGVMKDVVFSSVQPNQAGLVGFTFQSVIDPQFVLYRKSLVATPRNQNNNSENININTQIENTNEQVPDIEILDDDELQEGDTDSPVQNNSLNNNQ